MGPTLLNGNKHTIMILTHTKPISGMLWTSIYPPFSASLTSIEKANELRIVQQIIRK